MEGTDSATLTGKSEDELLDIAFDCYVEGNDSLLREVEYELHRRWQTEWPMEGGEKHGDTEDQA